MFEEYLLNNHKNEIINITKDVDHTKHFSINIKYIYFIFITF